MDIRYIEWTANLDQFKYLKVSIKKFKLSYKLLESQKIVFPYTIYEKWKVEGDWGEIERFLNYIEKNCYSIINNK